MSNERLIVEPASKPDRGGNRQVSDLVADPDGDVRLRARAAR